MLRLDGVTKSYGAKVALDGISLDVPGQRLRVAAWGQRLGQDGAAARHRGLRDARPRGDRCSAAKPVNSVPAHRRNIGFVFQNFALFPHLDVFENVAFGLRNAGRRPIAAKAIDARVRRHDRPRRPGGLERRGRHRRSRAASASAWPSPARS